MQSSSPEPVVRSAYPTQTAYLDGLRLSGSLNHGYLFEGIEGGGQDLLALTWATDLLCQQGSTACNGQCASCVERVKQAHPDYLAVTGSPGQPLTADTAGQIRQHLQYAPTIAPRRVVVVLEAHWLNRHATNALLKIMEEPPERALILLTSSRPELISATLQSRLQKVRVPALSHADMAVAAARLGIDPARQDALVHLADGRLGRLVELADPESETSLWWREQTTFWLDFLAGDVAVRDSLVTAQFLKPADAVQRQHQLSRSLAVLEAVLRDILLGQAGNAGLRTFPQFHAKLAALAGRLPTDRTQRSLEQVILLRERSEANLNKKMILDYLILGL